MNGALECYVSLTCHPVNPFLLFSLQMAPGFVSLKQPAVYSYMVLAGSYAAVSRMFSHWKQRPITEALPCIELLALYPDDNLLPILIGDVQDILDLLIRKAQLGL